MSPMKMRHFGLMFNLTLHHVTTQQIFLILNTLKYDSAKQIKSSVIS